MRDWDERERFEEEEIRREQFLLCGCAIHGEIKGKHVSSAAEMWESVETTSFVPTQMLRPFMACNGIII